MRRRDWLAPVPDEVDATAAKVHACVRSVRDVLGAGLPERFYQRALELELVERGIPFVPRPRVAVTYGTELLGHVCPDLIVEGHLVVELKAVETLLPVHEAQTLTYLSATGLPLALLINFTRSPSARESCAR